MIRKNSKSTATTTEGPIFLSRKFQRSIHNRVKKVDDSESQVINEDITRNESVAPAISVPHITTPVSMPVELDKAANSKTDAKKQRSNMGSGASNRDEKEVEVAAIEVKPYEPFHLRETSTYHPSTLDPSQCKKMSPITLARYKAYGNISPELSAKVAESERRSSQFLKELHLQRSKLQDKANMRLKIIRGNAKDDPQGKVFAAMAKKRVNATFKQMSDLRSVELEFLIEGYHALI